MLYAANPMIIAETAARLKAVVRSLNSLNLSRPRRKADQTESDEYRDSNSRSGQRATIEIKGADDNENGDTTQ